MQYRMSGIYPALPPSTSFRNSPEPRLHHWRTPPGGCAFLLWAEKPKDGQAAEQHPWRHPSLGHATKAGPGPEAQAACGVGFAPPGDLSQLTAHIQVSKNRNSFESHSTKGSPKLKVSWTEEIHEPVSQPGGVAESPETLSELQRPHVEN